MCGRSEWVSGSCSHGVLYYAFPPTQVIIEACSHDPSTEVQMLHIPLVVCNTVCLAKQYPAKILYPPIANLYCEPVTGWTCYDEVGGAGDFLDQ